MSARPPAGPLEVDDPRVLDLLEPGAAVDRLGGDASWSEGPWGAP